MTKETKEKIIRRGKPDPKIKPVPPYNGDSGYTFTPPQLDEKGRVIVSPVSLVAVADRRPVTMGERIRRYMRNPKPIEDLEYDPEDLEVDDLPDGHDNPMTNHEDRTRDFNNRQKAKAADRQKKESEELAEKQKAEKAALRARLLELQEEGSLPFSTPKGGSEAPK